MNRVKEVFHKFTEFFDFNYLKEVVNRLSEYSRYGGSRLAGTNGEHKAARFILDEFKRFGLEAYMDRIPVDTWICSSVRVIVEEPVNIVFNASAFPAVVENPVRVSGELVYVRYGIKDYLDKVDLNDKILLTDSCYESNEYITLIAREAQYRGARAVIFTHLSRGYYSSGFDDTLYLSNLSLVASEIMIIVHPFNSCESINLSQSVSSFEGSVSE